MINILVPTDFTASSLKIAESAIKTLDGEKVNIILFHAFELPFYYHDLLSGNNRPYLDLMNEDLRQACKKLKDQFPKQIDKITFQFMHGSSSAVFRNFSEANRIDCIVCPPDYLHMKVHARSVNPIRLFKKSKIKLLSSFSEAKAQFINQETIPVQMPYAMSTS